MRLAQALGSQGITGEVLGPLVGKLMSSQLAYSYTLKLFTQPHLCSLLSDFCLVLMNAGGLASGSSDSVM